MFNTFNSVVIMGNLTRDIEIRTLASGTRVGDFTIAVNDRIKRGEEWVDEASFVDVVAWDKTAELVERFAGKGKVVLVRGRLKQETWEDKQSGQKRSKLKVVAESVVFIGRGESDRQEKRGGSVNGSRTDAKVAPAGNSKGGSSGYAEAFTDDDDVVSTEQVPF